MQAIQQSRLSVEFLRGFMCAKQHYYKDAINYLRQAINEDSNLHASLLLADMFEAIDDLENAEQVYMSALDQIKRMEDQPLLIEVSLARIKCYTSDAKVIEDLKALENILNVNDIDTTRISLKAIVYDTLADYYFKLKKHSAAITYTDTKSITLKMRSLSNYHPSLARNYLLLGEMHVNHVQFRHALKYFKNAVEIQRLNLESDDMDIKLVYYRMGDIFCKMNQLDEALNRYNFAEDDDIADNTEEYTTDIKHLDDRRRLIARASMHGHLAQLYDQRTDFDSAIEEQLLCINVREELYPFDTLQRPIDMPTLVSRLEQLAFYTSRLADATALVKSENPESIYKKAMSVQRKLIRFKEIYTGEIHRKMGQYYERQQNDTEMAINCYREAVHESMELEATVKTYYALGRLTAAWAEDVHAAVVYYKKASNFIPDSEPQLKAIVETRCSTNQLPAYHDQNVAIRIKQLMQDSSSKEGNDIDNKLTENVTSSFQLYAGMLITHFVEVSVLTVARTSVQLKP